MTNHDSLTNEEKIFQMYEDLNVGKHPKCIECRSCTQNLSNPISFWFVGEKFEESKYKILFIGKNARGEPKLLNKNVGDVSELAKVLWLDKRAYFSYTRAIVERLYGESDRSNVAFTNCVKCNNSDGKDTTTLMMKNCCIKDLQVIRKEIDILKPKFIIFYTGWYYDKFFHDIFDNIESLTDTSNTLKIGSYNMPWWEFNANLNKNTIKVLRVGHPERKSKSDFVSQISNWVLRN
jgi:hypothetical protein